MSSGNSTRPCVSKIAASVTTAAVFFAIAVLTVGCTGLKYVPEGEVLYTGYEVKTRPIGKVRAQSRIRELMDQNVSPKPNTKILGMRPGVWFYYIAGPAQTKKGLRGFIKNKLGQVPIYMSDVDAERTATLIRGHLVNNGFFQAKVEHQVTINNKKGKVVYTAEVHRPYRLRKIEYPDATSIFRNIDSIRQESYLKVNQRYNLERLQAEQARIEESLENFGYYFFDDRHLIFEADSTVGNRQVDVSLMLENGVPPKARRIYRLGEVTVLPDYSLTQDTAALGRDTLNIGGYRYLDGRKNFRPEIITRVINLKRGNIYRKIDQEYTLAHLMSLGSFKFVDIRFDESQTDSSLLNARIYLTPHLKKSIRAELQATSKSNNFVGPGLSLTFTNRNFLKGSERFEVTVNTGYEVQVSRKLPEPLNAFELGVESSLSVPRFLTPLRIHYPSRKYLPTTDVKLGFRVQHRIGFFRLNSFNLGFGYTWRENTLKNHELFPIDVSYLKLGKASAQLRSLVIDNPYLARSLEDQFILGSRYTYTLNTQVNQERIEKFRETRFEKSQFYFTATVEPSGNLVHLLQGGQFKYNLESDSLKRIFGSAYAQYLRGEIDFRYFWHVDEKNTIASRLVFGTGYAYGNSVAMPYIKQFSTGGSNSVRAFPARSIGPGIYDVRSDTTNENRGLFLDQRGDIKLEGSVEFRFDIVKMLKGAVFADAGNVWLWREDTVRQGSGFDRNTFLKQLAVGTGVGLRFDFNFFVLRFDVAFPIRKPAEPASERWVFDRIAFGDRTWRRENLMLNIAIGYPF